MAPEIFYEPLFFDGSFLKRISGGFGLPLGTLSGFDFARVGKRSESK
jgi:hypothetical protein